MTFANTLLNDTPRTASLAAFIEREGPNGSGRVVGLSIEADGVLIYTESHLWCDDNGAGTFRGDSETAAIRAFRERVQPGNGCRHYPQPARFGPCECDQCMTFAHAVTDNAKTERESALAPRDTYSTVWRTDSAELIAPVGTVTRPRMYGDETGLFTLHTPDGRLVKTWSRVPTLKGVREALALAAETEADAVNAAARCTVAELERAEREALADADSQEARAKARGKGTPGAALLRNLAALRRIRAAAYRGAIVAARPDDVSHLTGGAERQARSLSAAATPAELADGYTSHDGTPARTAPQSATRRGMADAMARDAAELGQGGAFPLWAKAAERVADAIEESLDLYSDWRDQAESVRDFVEYPDAREVVAIKHPGGRWIMCGGAV